jgi:hypothetical protein
MIHHHSQCVGPDIYRDRIITMASGELRVVDRCRTCRATSHRVVDRTDLADLDLDDEQPARRGWPWPPPGMLPPRGAGNRGAHRRGR